MKLTKKRRSQRGETYVEVLMSVLILALSALVIATSVTAAKHINASARKADESFYSAVSALESGAGNVSKGSVQYEIGGESDAVEVDVYTDENGELAAYGKSKEAGA